MTTSKTIVLIDPQRNPRGIPHYNPGRSLKAQNKVNLSEYQAVYKKWNWQKPRTCIRPQINKIQLAAPMKSNTTYRTDYAEPKLTAMQKKKQAKQKGLGPQYKYLQDEVIRVRDSDRKTTYATDYCPKEIQKRRPFTAVGEQSYRLQSSTFSGKSMYQVSYQSYSPDVIKSCRPNLIVPHSLLHSNVDRHKEEFGLEIENIEEVADTPAKNPSHSNSKSSKPGSKVTEQEPNQDSQEKSKKFQENVSVQFPEPPVEKEPDPSLVTTFMADFKPNWNVKKRTPCKPVETNYRTVVTPFDGTTTQSAEYKAWPVSKPEVPIWAQKPVYKLPLEGMALNSTYMMDYSDPKVIQTVAAMKPSTTKEDIIKSSGDSSVFNPSTTYTVNFKEWKGAQPAKTYLVKSVYNPPKEKMDCESTHRSYYKGHEAQKAELVRHASEHRQLNRDGKQSFHTTYRETYKDHRPKSCPGAVRGPVLGIHVKTAWEEDLSTKKQLNESRDSGIDMIDSQDENEVHEVDDNVKK